MNFFFSFFFSCLDFETKKIIEGGICQKSAEVRNETLGNKLHICFTWLVSKTFRTSSKNDFKKVGRPLTQNTPRYPNDFFRFLKQFSGIVTKKNFVYISCQ